MGAADVWSIRDMLAWCEGYLKRHGDKDPRRSAQSLIAAATGLERIQLYMDLDRPLTGPERDELRGTVKRRAQGEPLQYILGAATFRYIDVKVEPGVLIPRPETEGLVSAVLDGLTLHECQNPFICEVGTGTGCIACSIADEMPTARVVATDISAAACHLAAENAESLGVSDRVEICECDMGSGIDAALLGTFDALVSNPPYIPTQVYEGLDAEVHDFEPPLALDGGTDGLEVFRRLIDFGLVCLKPGGLLAVELFEGHLDKAASLAREKGYREVSIEDDLAGRPRVLTARFIGVEQGRD